MRVRGFIKVCLFGIFGLGVVFLIYFLIGSKSSPEIYRQYESLKPNTSSSYTKTLQFLTSYVITTGDSKLAMTVGMTEEDIEYMKNPTAGEVGEILGSSPTSTVIEDDVLAMSAAVAERFKKTGQPNYKPSGWVNPGGLFFNYSQSNGMYQELSYNGKTVKTTHRDCSCYCSAMRYLLGMDSNYVHRNSSSFKSNVPDVTSTVHTFGDCRVGDVLWKNGHVAMIVKVDSSKVYVGDCGSGETSDHGSGTIGHNIDNTAAQGYSYTFSVNDSFSGNSKGFERVLR